MAEQKTPRLTKRMKTVRGKVDRSKMYPVDDALKLVKENAVAKFDESVDVAVNLGVDAKKSDQTVRGSVVLPSGTGKKVRVAVFAQGEKAKDATAAGADIVGFEDLAAKIKEGFMDFDVVIASPDAMRVVGQLGQILGPRGLMPNPKVGTVNADVVLRMDNVGDEAKEISFLLFIDVHSETGELGDYDYAKTRCDGTIPPKGSFDCKLALIFPLHRSRSQFGSAKA